jgi:signal recognition particle subunit SRP68
MRRCRRRSRRASRRPAPRSRLLGSVWASLIATDRCYHLARVYGLLNQFDKALVVNDHASLYLRQTRTALSLEGANDENATESFPELTPAALDDLSGLITAQREQLTKAWYAHNTAPPPSKETLGMSDLSIGDANATAAKKNPVFDISYNYVTETDVAALEALAEGQEVPVKEVEMEEAPATSVEAPEVNVAEPPKKKGLWGLWR